MSSGYVTTNIATRPDRINTSKQPISVSFANLSGTRFNWNLNAHRYRNPITTYRSGPSYERSFRLPGAILSDRNVNELYAEIGGDFGHEFSMRRVAEFYGKTVSKRPDATASASWGTLTNPTPTFWNGGGPSGPQVTDAYDSAWSFVKSDAELVSLGTSFIKSTTPIQSQVNLLSDIAEAVSSGFFLPELLGKQIVSSVVSPKKRRDLIRALGGEYLNFIFGVKPLADDIAKVGFLIDTVNDLVDQWIKDNGTIVRRRRKVIGNPKVVMDKGHKATSTQLSSSFTPQWIRPPQPGFVESTGFGTSVESSLNMAKVTADGFSVARTFSDISFSAGYEYDLSVLALSVPDDASAADLMHSAALRGELIAIAFGLDASSLPRAVYDALPFSWLLDWFVNIGDLIDNFRNLQSKGVQMHWGYISETVTREYYQEWYLTWVPTQKVFFQSNGFLTQKAIRRIRATPFGFGTSFGSLSADQSAILAALAATR